MLLVSRNPDLTREVENTLAGHFMVTTCFSLEQVRGRLGETEDPCSGILVDISGELSWEQCLTDLKRGRAPILAILQDAGERQAAFLAGADDYLLQPLLFEELITRLNHASRVQRLKSGRDDNNGLCRQFH